MRRAGPFTEKDAKAAKEAGVDRAAIVTALRMRGKKHSGSHATPGIGAIGGGTAAGGAG